MGLRSRRRASAPARPTWDPLDGEVTAVPVHELNDDGCAGDWGYEAWFFGPHGACIAVTFYAAYGATEGTYALGYRYQYWPGQECRQHVTTGWSYAGYGCADENFTGCESLTEAGKYALGAAQTVVRKDGSEGQLMAALAEVFQWDGVPW